VSRLDTGPPRIVILALFVVVTSALAVLLIRAPTGSWVTGGVVGAISGGLAAGAYPALLRGRPR